MRITGLEPAKQFDKEKKALSPCWILVGAPAGFRIYIPKESVDYHGYERRIDGISPYTYDFVGEYTSFNKLRI